MSQRRHHARVLVTACLVLVVGCSSPAAVERRSTETTTPTSTTTAAMAPATTVSAPTHDDHLVSEPGSPLGVLPSFNESPGCDALQGVRGPYADTAGRLPFQQTVAGPWGDFYGRFLSVVRDALVPMGLPSLEGEPPVVIYVHERVAPALQAVIENLEQEQEGGRSYRIDPGSTFSFAPVTVAPKRYLSFHAVGAAIDINASTNPYRADNELITDMPDWFVQAWTDAGWCWGGDWQQIKDPMHFSWKGPRYTPEYSIPDRVPPSNPAGSFQRSVAVETGLGSESGGSSAAVVDLDRDGAADAVRIVRDPATGMIDVIAARAIHRYDTCFRLGPTPDAATPATTHLMADATGDGRRDLWDLTPSEDGLAITVFTFATSYTSHMAMFEVPVFVDSSASLLLGDHDLDGIADLHVVRRGTGSSVTVLRGPDFDRTIATAPLEGVGEGWRFALGLRDADRVPDLFAVSPGEPALVAIFGGSDGFAVDPELLDTAVLHHEGAMAAEDFDGDGHADLVFLEPDGVLISYLGGEWDEGVTDADLMSWFLERDDQPWEYRSGCPQNGRLPR